MKPLNPETDCFVCGKPVADAKTGADMRWFLGPEGDKVAFCLHRRECISNFFFHFYLLVKKTGVLLKDFIKDDAQFKDWLAAQIAEHNEHSDIRWPY